MQEVIPPHVKLPAMEPYHGTINPDDHLSNFRSIMMFHGASDAILCQAFHSTLREFARTWFNGLKPSSVDSFNDMGQLFISQFVSRHRHRRRSDSLFEVKQREGESLRCFLSHFNMTMFEVDHLNNEMAMFALAGGVLKEGDFYFAIKVNYLKNLSHMMVLADKYARVKESEGRSESSNPRRRRRKARRRTNPFTLQASLATKELLLRRREIVLEAQHGDSINSLRLPRCGHKS